MSEFMQVASQITPDVQRMMFEGIQSLALKASRKSFFNMALHSVQGGKMGWILSISCLTLGAAYAAFKGGEYFWLKPILDRVQETNDEIKKWEIPHEILNRLVNQRNGEIAAIEKGIVELTKMVGVLTENRKECLREIGECEKSRQTLREELSQYFENFYQLVGELTRKLEKIKELREEIHKIDSGAFHIYEESIRQENAFSELLEGIISQFPPATSNHGFA